MAFRVASQKSLMVTNRMILMANCYDNKLHGQEMSLTIKSYLLALCGIGHRLVENTYSPSHIVYNSRQKKVDSHTEVAVVYCVRFLNSKVRFCIPGESSKIKVGIIFLQRHPLSRFLSKTLRVNKPCYARKKFLKNLLFGVDVKHTT